MATLIRGRAFRGLGPLGLGALEDWPAGSTAASLALFVPRTLGTTGAVGEALDDAGGAEETAGSCRCLVRCSGRGGGESCSSSSSSSSLSSSFDSLLSETYSALSTLPSWLPSSSSSSGFPFEMGESQFVHACIKFSRKH